MIKVQLALEFELYLVIIFILLVYYKLISILLPLKHVSGRIFFLDGCFFLVFISLDLVIIMM
jgi:hypothetical protein